VSKRFNQGAEKIRQRRSRLESILNVAERLRLRCFHRLRPCWTAFLSTLLANLYGPFNVTSAKSYSHKVYDITGITRAISLSKRETLSGAAFP